MQVGRHEKPGISAVYPRDKGHWYLQFLEESLILSDMTTAWLLLVFAGLMEVGWAIGLKYTEGFTKLYPSLLTLAAMAVSMICLAKATHELPIGTAYAVWVGIGVVGAAILGIVLFKEPVTPARIACLVLLIASIVGLKLTAA